jgi:hypothetical protein
MLIRVIGLGLKYCGWAEIASEIFAGGRFQCPNGFRREILGRNFRFCGICAKSRLRVDKAPLSR